ncbi:DsbA family protein [Streptomyces sp. NPDC050164]|uniref:DsbA family protein n=1 Tax=Streptomyces sp. NPDC050164 TaxID=3365605 RepID=UPI00379ACA06
MQQNARTPRRVEFVLDLICVHSYIALTRFSRAVKRYRDSGGEAEVVFRPYQLAPETPPTGRPLFEVHKESFGEEKARAIAQDTGFGAQDGLSLNFERAVYTNTFEAHLLLADAAGQGLGEAMAERLFRAYLTDGLNIGDPSTLARLADEIGVVRSEDGATALRAELDSVRRLGVDSVPLVLFDGGPALSGAQPEAVYLHALDTPPAPPVEG